MHRKLTTSLSHVQQEYTGSCMLMDFRDAVYRSLYIAQTVRKYFVDGCRIIPGSRAISPGQFQNTSQTAIAL